MKTDELQLRQSCRKIPTGSGGPTKCKSGSRVGFFNCLVFHLNRSSRSLCVSEINSFYCIAIILKRQRTIASLDLGNPFRKALSVLNSHCLKTEQISPVLMQGGCQSYYQASPTTNHVWLFQKNPIISLAFRNMRQQV